MTTKKTLVLNKIVDKFSMLHDLISNKTSFTNSLLLFFFFLTFNGYSQLSIEYFEGGIPSTWANKNNNVGTSLWTSTTDG
ncbi:MAG TPA: hypothetical protein VN192_04860, partial [Flavobacterium sp.]|nr:hypothetical protein [Flavobacterium sp.]